MNKAPDNIPGLFVEIIDFRNWHKANLPRRPT
jgi:hypothetical protein